MNRVEATQAIGRRACAWTVANGVYVGKLVEVKAVQGSPWRGVVLIDGVVKVAIHNDAGYLMRRGYRPGEKIEVGGQNVELTDATGSPTYEEALIEHIDYVRRTVEQEKRLTRGEREDLLAAGRGSQAALKAERVRAAGGVWQLEKAVAA